MLAPPDGGVFLPSDPGSSRAVPAGRGEQSGWYGNLDGICGRGRGPAGGPVLRDRRRPGAEGSQRDGDRARRSPRPAVAGAAAPPVAGRIRRHGGRRGPARARAGLGAAGGRPADRRDHGPVRAADRGPGRPPSAPAARARRRGRHRGGPGRPAHRDEGLHRRARPVRSRPGPAGPGRRRRPRAAHRGRTAGVGSAAHPAARLRIRRRLRRHRGARPAADPPGRAARCVRPGRLGDAGHRRHRRGRAAARAGCLQERPPRRGRGRLHRHRSAGRGDARRPGPAPAGPCQPPNVGGRRGAGRHDRRRPPSPRDQRAPAGPSCRPPGRRLPPGRRTRPGTS